jgi:hypothetical protein
VGTPSDEVPEILATGHGDITTLFVSLSARHPEGADADYLRWHTLDHRPEQQRLAAVRTSLRAVSTPACRLARAACHERFAAVDHLMIYFFTGTQGLEAFGALSAALRDAGRSPFILPPVQRGVYSVSQRVASPRAKVGADVLPWLPVRGVYLLIEEGETPAVDLAEVPGVAGVWCAGSVATHFSQVDARQQLTLCFLDGDPVEVAGRLGNLLQQGRQTPGTRPLLAAPFHTIIPYEWDRYLP